MLKKIFIYSFLKKIWSSNWRKTVISWRQFWLSSIFPMFDRAAMWKKGSGVLVDKMWNGINELHTGTVPCPVLGPQCKRDINVREWVWEGITRMSVSLKERLTSLVLFTVRKRRARWGTLLQNSTSLRGFWVADGCVWKGERGASQIAARKILVRCMDTIVQNFSVEVGQHRNKLTKEGVEMILWRF